MACDGGYYHAMSVAFDQRWSDRGTCAGLSRKNPNLYDKIFFPEKGRPSNNPAFKQFCSVCPVQMLCLKFAVVNDLDGVWGNTTRSQRENLPPSVVQEFLAEGRELGYKETYYVPKATAQTQTLEDTELVEVHLQTIENILGPLDFLFPFEYEEYLQKTQRILAVFEVQPVE
jgi:hypothetical protein